MESGRTIHHRRCRRSRGSSDHFGDLDAFIVGSWLSGRYTPLHVCGGSGETPELGTKAAVEALVKALAWDLKGRTGILPDAGGQVIAHEFDYKQENQVVYEKNGVKITSWPATHSLFNHAGLQESASQRRGQDV